MRERAAKRRARGSPAGDPGFTLAVRAGDELVFTTDPSVAAAGDAERVYVDYADIGVTLKPGDLILTGTPGGVGVFRKPPLFLKDGDVVTCEIDGLGKVTNMVRACKRAKL